jgi:hypothetical protein
VNHMNLGAFLVTSTIHLIIITIFLLWVSETGHLIIPMSKYMAAARRTCSFRSDAVSKAQANYDVLRRTACDIIDQHSFVLRTVSDQDYTRKLSTFYNASVASHIRHSLDHFNAVVNVSLSYDSEPMINYDVRSRNTTVETSRSEALSSVASLHERVLNLDMDLAVKAAFMGTANVNFMPYTSSSSAGRELSFAAHHAIHHLSMIKLMMMSMKYEFADDSQLGLAPSTTLFHLL